MRIPFKSLVFLCLSSLTTVALADPPRPSHNYWRNTNYPTHYVLYDYVSRSYVETVDCKALHRFRALTNALNTLTLYDDSRGMTMQVNYEGMWLKAAGASTFTFYQAGTFDTREQFSHIDARGMPTGSIYRTSGCRWQEKLTGSAAPNYNFRNAQVG